MRFYFNFLIYNYFFYLWVTICYADYATAVSDAAALNGVLTFPPSAKSTPLTAANTKLDAATATGLAANAALGSRYTLHQKIDNTTGNAFAASCGVRLTEVVKNNR